MPFYFFILLLCYRPISILLGVDGAGRFAVWLSVIVFIVCGRDSVFQDVLKNKLNRIWGMLFLYHFFNSIIKGVVYRGGYISVFYTFFPCYTILILAGYMYKMDEFKALRFYMYAYLMYVILFVFSGVTILGSGRLSQTGVGSHINVNQFAPVCGIILLLLSYTKQVKEWRVSRVILIALPIIVLLVLTGSRNGLIFLSFFFFSLFWSALQGEKNVVRRLFIIGGSMILLYIGFEYLMSNTVVGARALDTQEQAIRRHLEPTGIWLIDNLGDRSIFYILGWENFIEHPITGIGYYNFSKYNEFLYTMHSEYMIHLAEGGIIAFLLYASYYVLVIKQLYSQKEDMLSVLLLFSVIVYLLVGLTAREFMYSQFYPLMGIWAVKTQSNKDKEIE